MLTYSATGFCEDSVKIHAPVAESFSCSEHYDGQLKHLGDALGTDCIVVEMQTTDDRSFMTPFKNNGHKNEDWFGYGKKVLAPCNCTVTKVNINDVINKPGVMTPGRAAGIKFKKDDGTFIVIAHVADVIVKEGDIVEAGEVIASIGNNGYSRNPHLHIAAWRKGVPLQIQFDQKTLALEYRNNKSF